MELIRLLLLQVESGEKPGAMDRYSEAEILYHCGLAIEAGLLDGVVVLGQEGEIGSAMLRKLTWDGHDFLDVARDEKAWAKATQKILKSGGAWTFDLLKQVLVEVAKGNLFS